MKIHKAIFWKSQISVSRCTFDLISKKWKNGFYLISFQEKVLWPYWCVEKKLMILPDFHLKYFFIWTQIDKNIDNSNRVIFFSTTQYSIKTLSFCSRSYILFGTQKPTSWCVRENRDFISKTFSEQIRWLNGKVLDWYTLFFLFQISFFRNNLMSNIVVRCKIKKFPGTFSLTSVKENGRLLYCDIAIWVEKETLFLTPFFTSVWKLTQSWRL